MSLIEDVEPGGSSALLSIQEWRDVEVEIALDSWCCAHIMDAGHDAPGYSLKESEGSRYGKGLVVGNGDRVANEGEVALNLEAPDMKGGSGLS